MGTYLGMREIVVFPGGTVHGLHQGHIEGLHGIPRACRSCIVTRRITYIVIWDVYDHIWPSDLSGPLEAHQEKGPSVLI